MSPATPELTQLGQTRAKLVLSTIIHNNSQSIFFREARSLAQFRASVPPQGSSDSDDFTQFHASVPLSTYEDYAPFINRFFSKPCEVTQVKDLLAPGLPYFIATSSGTSSGRAKHFPKYRHPQSGAHLRPAPRNGGTMCLVYGLTYSSVVNPVSGGNMMAAIPVCVMSAGALRMHVGIDVARDEEYKGTRLPNHTSPLAAMYIPVYPTFIFVHVLFALADPHLELISALFGSFFRDFCRVLEEHFDDMVSIIDTGTLHDMAGIAHVKDHLQKYLKPNRTRALELKGIGKSGEQGWLKRLWPNLTTVFAITSGTFSTVIPELQHFLGPGVELKAQGIVSSEAYVAFNCGRDEEDLFKINGSDEFIEFLDLGRPEDSSSLVQTWNVVPGRKYEVVLTTRDGLWRYRLDDVVEVAGFDPHDGLPLVRYAERRSVNLRNLTESDLRGAVSAILPVLGTSVSEFCVGSDHRATISCYSFFVELHNNLGSHAHLAPRRLLEHLCAVNEGYRNAVRSRRYAPPNIRVLHKGAFCEYREWRMGMGGAQGGCTSVQVKVPVVVGSVETVEWLGERVVQELCAAAGAALLDTRTAGTASTRATQNILV